MLRIAGSDHKTERASRPQFRHQYTTGPPHDAGRAPRWVQIAAVKEVAPPSQGYLTNPPRRTLATRRQETLLIVLLLEPYDTVSFCYLDADIL